MVEAIKELLEENKAINKEIEKGFKIISKEGKVGFEELDKVIKRISANMGIEPPKTQDLENVFKGIDRDADGAIDYQQFSKLIKDILSSIIQIEEDNKKDDDIDIDNDI